MMKKSFCRKFRKYSIENILSKQGIISVISRLFFSSVFLWFFLHFFVFSCASRGVSSLSNPNIKIKEMIFDDRGNLILKLVNVKYVSLCAPGSKDCSDLPVNSLFLDVEFKISKPSKHTELDIIIFGFGGEKKSFRVNFQESKIYPLE